MRRIMAVLALASITVAACSDRSTPTAPDLRAPTNHAAFEAGPNDRFVGSWNCTGNQFQALNCLNTISLEAVAQGVVNGQIAIVQTLAAAIGPNAKISCTISGRVFVDRTSGKITNGEPYQDCSVSTPQNVQTVIVYPNPYDQPKKKEP